MALQIKLMSSGRSVKPMYFCVFFHLILVWSKGLLTGRKKDSVKTFLFFVKGFLYCFNTSVIIKSFSTITVTQNKHNRIDVSRLIYTGEFRVRFRIKLTRFVKKIFITKCASLVRNRPRYCANVNDPLNDPANTEDVNYRF